MWRRLSVTIGLCACATPEPSESTLGAVWTGTPRGDMVALTSDDGRLPPRWQALPTWWVKPGWTPELAAPPPIPEIQVLPDEAGEPAWVLIGGGSRSAVQLRGLGGRRV